ncbi:MAG: hypothetical protein AMS22_15720 [Thiotrichales bacterium SG8_50]|nr:MAG: hypothetical protein AMS22_15720 [Thiotrichales bacterium SG8_50]
MKTSREIKDGYDKLAAVYAVRFCDELNGKPFDRSLLQRFVTAVPDGPVCDLGCGPGHVAAHLQTLGANSMGFDLSPKMIAEAERRYPTVEYRVGDMADLDMPSESLGGIVALYSIIHLERQKLEEAFREMHRVLKPAGQLLVSFHKGEGILHEDNVLDTDVSFDCTLFEPDEVSGKLERVGFSIAEATVRRPYDFEYPTKRVYVLADKPTS